MKENERMISIMELGKKVGRMDRISMANFLMGGKMERGFIIFKMVPSIKESFWIINFMGEGIING